MKRLLSIIVILSLFVSITLAEGNNKSNYDKLQYLFSTITFETTMEEVEAYLTENNLPYYKEKYNGNPAEYSYKIAFTKDDLLSRSSPDSVQISFNRSNGELLYASYHNYKSFLTALIYRYGIYWELQEKEPNNNYEGIYFYKPGGKNIGITITYKNGNKKETPYIKCSDIDEALRNVINPDIKYTIMW